jgi:hypothetical protein
MVEVMKGWVEGRIPTVAARMVHKGASHSLLLCVLLVWMFVLVSSLLLEAEEDEDDISEMI